MEIKSLEKLRFNGETYELYSTVISNNKVYSVYEFPTTEKHEMRIDTICNDIYGTTDFVDILCNVNGIVNPLNVKADTIIYFPEDDDIEDIKTNESLMKDIIESVSQANVGKEFKRDKNRTKDLNNRPNTEKEKTYIPPNIVQSTDSSIEVNNGKVILKPNF